MWVDNNSGTTTGTVWNSISYDCTACSYTNPYACCYCYYSNNTQVDQSTVIRGNMTSYNYFPSKEPSFGKLPKDFKNKVKLNNKLINIKREILNRKLMHHDHWYPKIGRLRRIL